jgi:hypothetical protein
MAEMHAGLRFAFLSVNFDGTNLRLTGLIRGALFFLRGCREPVLCHQERRAIAHVMLLFSAA